ncbi:MAG: hypothetical protein LV479_06650 [Methylacidiphilales bacterium]|nr:hypothetical protein [Candidatus Methylacidiphilales bacterium]
MNATYLYLTLGAVALTGQISSTDPGVTYSISSNSNPNPAYQVAPTNTDDLTLYPLPPVRPKLAKFTISPGTIRQGYDYKKILKSLVVLSAPAIVDYPCHIASSDPTKLVCSDVVVPKGSYSAEGTVQVNWVNVDDDDRVRVKAYSADDPLDDIWYTVWLRRDRSIKLPTPTPTPRGL